MTPILFKSCNGPKRPTSSSLSFQTLRCIGVAGHLVQDGRPRKITSETIRACRRMRAGSMAGVVCVKACALNCRAAGAEPDQGPGQRCKQQYGAE
jgi:hypothetical protein